MSQPEKIESEIAKLSDRRRAILTLPEIEYRIAMFGDVDETIMKMAERVSGQCNSHFDAVLELMHKSQINQINAIQQNTRLTEQALKGNTANLFAIQALTEEIKIHKDSLSIMAGVESTGKKAGGFVKWLVNSLAEVGAFCKKPLGGIAAIIFIIALFAGRISLNEIVAFFSKILGG